MTVEVVGQSEESYKFVVCRNCGARLRYVRADIKSYDKRDYTGDLDTYHYIVCPRCNERIFVKPC